MAPPVLERRVARRRDTPRFASALAFSDRVGVRSAGSTGATS
jgi:hypothetical protein